jgi:hypothetical protein
MKKRMGMQQGVAARRKLYGGVLHNWTLSAAEVDGARMRHQPMTANMHDEEQTRAARQHQDHRRRMARAGASEFRRRRP